jgi:hypothetical protein
MTEEGNVKKYMVKIVILISRLLLGLSDESTLLPLPKDIK